MQFLQSLLGREQHTKSSNADHLVHFIGGGLSGITAATTTYPLDLIRTRLAAQVFQLLPELLRSRSIYGHCTYVDVIAMPNFIQLWQRNSIYYRGVSHAFKTIFREEGFVGLYKGLGPTLLVWFSIISSPFLDNNFIKYLMP